MRLTRASLYSKWFSENRQPLKHVYYLCINFINKRAFVRDTYTETPSKWDSRNRIHLNLQDVKQRYVTYLILRHILAL